MEATELPGLGQARAAVPVQAIPMPWPGSELVCVAVRSLGRWSRRPVGRVNYPIPCLYQPGTQHDVHPVLVCMYPANAVMPLSIRRWHLKCATAASRQPWPG